MIPRSLFSVITPLQYCALIWPIFMLANSFDSLHSAYKGHIGWHPIGITLAGVAETAHELRLYPLSETSARAAVLDYPKSTTNDVAYSSALFHVGLACAERNDPYAAGPYLQKSLENFYDVSRLHNTNYFTCEPMQAVADLYLAHNHPEEAMQLFESQISRLEMQKWRLQAQNQPVNYSLIESFYHRAGNLSYLLGYYGSSERTAGLLTETIFSRTGRDFSVSPYRR
jgi:hypothetical protein